jgi:glycosyltransferase involved in cell wall biosynthesis
MKDRGHFVKYLDYNEWGRNLYPSLRDIWDTDVIHFICAIGCRKFLYILFIRFFLGKNVFVHFVGSDILRLQKVKLFDRFNWKLALMLAHRVFTGAPWHIKEIENFIQAEPLILFFNNYEELDELIPLPEKFTVLSYLPPGKPDFYGDFLVKELIQKFPQIQFIILGIDEFSHFPNVTSIPINYNLNLKQLYTDISMLIRLTSHDGFSSMILEAMSMGRNIIWTYDIPYGLKTARNIGSIIEVFEQSIPAKLNADGAQWVRKNFNFSNFLNELETLYKQPKFQFTTILYS